MFFADDTSVFLEGTDNTKLIKTVNTKIDKLTVWLNVNKRTINSKRKLITYYSIGEREKC